jgi:hypothetical protein
LSIIKLIIADQNTKTIESPIWFGGVWKHIHSALNKMGAFSTGEYYQKAALVDTLHGAAFTETEFHAIFKFSILWVNTVGFENREDRQLNMMQSINSCGYDFLKPNESYIYMGMDFGGVANDALLNIAQELMLHGYKAYFSVQENLVGEYIPLTEMLIANSLEKNAVQSATEHT